MGLSYGENFIIQITTVFDWSTRVTDGQTDGQTDDSIQHKKITGRWDGWHTYLWTIHNNWNW